MSHESIHTETKTIRVKGQDMAISIVTLRSMFEDAEKKNLQPLPPAAERLAGRIRSLMGRIDDENSHFFAIINNTEIVKSFYIIELFYNFIL